MEKFSRWLRAICTILLSRNSPSDRTKALGYVEQAVAVLDQYAHDPDNENVSASFGAIQRAESGVSQVYPMDERQWLLGTSYNTGIECLQYTSRSFTQWNVALNPSCSVSLVDEARRWFESSTIICRYVPDGPARAEKVSFTPLRDIC